MLRSFQAWCRRFGQSSVFSTWRTATIIILLVSSSFLVDFKVDTRVISPIFLSQFYLQYGFLFIGSIRSVVNDWFGRTGLLLLVAATIVEQSSPGDGMFVLVLNSIQTLRVFKLSQKWESARVMIHAILISISSLVQFAFMLIIFIYPSAVLSTRFIGQNERFINATTDEGQMNEDLWGNLLKSSLTLFQISTLDWGDIARASITIEPLLTIPFVVFILVTGYTIANIFITMIGNNYSNLDIGDGNFDMEWEDEIRQKVAPWTVEDDRNSDVEEWPKPVKEFLASPTSKVDKEEAKESPPEFTSTFIQPKDHSTIMLGDASRTTNDFINAILSGNSPPESAYSSEAPHFDELDILYMIEKFHQEMSQHAMKKAHNP